MNLFSNSIVFAFLIAASGSRFLFANASSSTTALDNHHDKSQNKIASGAATIHISYNTLEALVLADDRDAERRSSFSRLLKENNGKIGALLQGDQMVSSRRSLKSSKSGKSSEANSAGTTTSKSSKTGKAAKATAPTSTTVAKKSLKASRYNAFRKNKKSGKASAKAELLSEECLNDELSSSAVYVFIYYAFVISSVDFDENAEYYAEFCQLPTGPEESDVICDLSTPDDDTSEMEICEDSGGHLYSTTVVVNNLPNGYTVYLENSTVCIPDICDADIFIKYLDNLASITMSDKSGKSGKSQKRK